MFIPKYQVIAIVSEAISGRNILSVEYQHTSDEEIVRHKIAPFDIGSTNSNLQIRERNADKLYAYSFTHIDRKSNNLDPKVCAFNINNFLIMNSTGETFDETDLAILNLQKTKYDYRNCNFALLPNRDWFS